jgi:hypothetical protein
MTTHRAHVQVRAAALSAMLVLLLASACSSRKPQGESSGPEPIPECDAFLASYQHCLEKLGPPAIAQARIAQTRAAFDATQGTTARTALRKTCAQNLSQLSTTCR